MSVLKASSALALYCNVFGNMFLFGNAYSVLLEPHLIVLLFFLLKVLYCSGVFGSNFFCDPVIRIFLVKGGQVVLRSVFFLFFPLLQSVSWRSLTWFWVRFRKLVFLSSLLQHWPAFRQCLNIDPSAQSGTKAQVTLAEQAPTSNSDSQKQILIFNSDFRKQTSTFKLRFSKTKFHFPKHTPILKLPFSKANSFIQTPISENKLPFFLKQTSIFQFNFLKTNSDFQQNKHRFFKSNSNVPLSFRTYTRLGEIRD